MPRPFFKITAGGVDITSKLVGLGVSLTITDGVGQDSDTIALVIDDQDGRVSAPKTGVILQVEGGYLDGEQRDFGQFKVDQVQYSGWPQQISISAQSVDAKSEQKQKQVEEYSAEDYPTYGDIYTKVAGRMGLKLAISDDVKAKKVSFEFQGEENDLAFSTRLGAKLDASITVKSGNLIVAKRGTGKSISGKDLPPIYVLGNNNTNDYNCTWKDKPKHTEVEATYFDRDAVEVKKVTAKAGKEGPTFVIRTPFQDENEAQLAADSQAKDLVRGEASASFTIDGSPSARAEAYVIVKGIRSQVDGTWRATSVTHNFSAEGPYTTGIECEPPADEAGEKAAAGKPAAETPAVPGDPPVTSGTPSTPVGTKAGTADLPVPGTPGGDPWTPNYPTQSR